jgi:non-ribosomal peptide synthetase component F
VSGHHTIYVIWRGGKPAPGLSEPPATPCTRRLGSCTTAYLSSPAVRDGSAPATFRPAPSLCAAPSLRPDRRRITNRRQPSGKPLRLLGSSGDDYGVPVLAVDELDTHPFGASPAPDTRPGDLVLLIYTSGSTGRPIFRKEIESVLCRHDAVLEAAVIGVPDEMYGRCRWPTWSPTQTPR